MKNSFYKAAGISLLSLGLTIAPVAQLAVAQDTRATETENAETAGEEFNDAGQSLQNAGEETVDGLQQTGENLEQGVDK